MIHMLARRRTLSPHCHKRPTVRRALHVSRRFLVIARPVDSFPSILSANSPPSEDGLFSSSLLGDSTACQVRYCQHVEDTCNCRGEECITKDVPPCSIVVGYPAQGFGRNQGAVVRLSTKWCGWISVMSRTRSLGTGINILLATPAG
jgi:hypothetical protein